MKMVTTDVYYEGDFGKMKFIGNYKFAHPDGKPAKEWLMNKVRHSIDEGGTFECLNIRSRELTLEELNWQQIRSQWNR